METTPLTIAVDAEAAQIYATASPEEQRKMQAMLILRLQAITDSPASALREAIDQISREAQAKGLTPEILESILRGEEE